MLKKFLWWWVVVVVLESKLSDQLWLSFSLALAKPNKMLSSSKVLLVKTMHSVLISPDLSKMVYISPLEETHSGQTLSHPHIFLAELGELPGMEREVTAGRMEVREIVGWDWEHHTM